jgi:uncharacterized lipoprotein YmbA
MKNQSLILVGALSLALAACGHSPQTRFYTLDAAPAVSTTASTYEGPSLHLGAVKIPAVFDRPEIARDTGAAEISVDEFSHWGGALDGLLRNALQSDLAATLPAGKFALDVADRQSDTQEISVTILAIRTTAGETSMDVLWTQAGKDAKGVRTSLTHKAHLSVAGASAMPAAYSENISALMAQLAASIEQGASAGSTS